METIISFKDPQTLDNYNNELEEADAEIERGMCIFMEDLLKEMEQWYKALPEDFHLNTRRTNALN